MVVAASAVEVAVVIVEAAAEAATTLAVPAAMIALSAVTLVFIKISNTN